MKQSHSILIIVGVIGILASVSTQIFLEPPAVVTLTLINASTIMVVIGTIQLMKGEKGPTHDERTKKISQISMSYSWLSTIVILSTTFWIDYFSVIMIDVPQLIGFLTFWMILTTFGMQSFLQRRGDVSTL